MRLQLFYRKLEDQDKELESVITDRGLAVEVFHIDDHREDYDHEDPNLSPENHGGSCFCDLPDYSDPVWPKLYNDYAYIASGVEAIKLVDFSKLN